MSRDDDALKAEHHRIAGQSGFVLQIGLAAQIEKEGARCGWRLLDTEYPWHLPFEREPSGYIDIIAAQGAVNAVIECKKATAGAW